MSKTREPRTEKRRLDDLHPFPQQGDFFDELTDRDLRALADDIAANGLKCPVEILPRNKAGYKPDTIVCGHQRTRALRLLGRVEADVVVRYDFASADAAEIEREFLADNQLRRHQDMLAKMRVALRLIEIERKRPRGRLRTREEADARDRVGKAVGVSGRTFSRYFRVLKTPAEVQNAFRAGLLPLVVAERVADLPAKTREAIAAKIASGQEPKQVVAEFLPARDRRHKKVADALGSFARALRRGLADLDGRIEEVHPSHAQKHLELLRNARRALKQLIGRATE